MVFGVCGGVSVILLRHSRKEEDIAHSSQLDMSWPCIWCMVLFADLVQLKCSTPQSDVETREEDISKRK